MYIEGEVSVIFLCGKIISDKNDYSNQSIYVYSESLKTCPEGGGDKCICKLSSQWKNSLMYA